MIETLKGISSIGGFSVVVMDELRKTHPEMFRPDGSMHYHMFEEKIRPYNFIYIRHDTNSLSFTLQNGPIKEAGKNGCQVDTIIAAARQIIEGLNEKFPCAENMEAMNHLTGALVALNKRRVDRETRGVEGINQP